MNAISTSKALLRGILLRCPQCGQGKLFRKYLSPVETCAHCTNPIADLRADDGPAWLTILLVGHIIAPMFIYAVRHPSLPDWLVMTGLLASVTVLVALLLPLSKGAFIGMLWKIREDRKNENDL